MRIIMTLALAVLLVVCSPKQQTETKDMNQLSFTTEQAAWMSAIACDEAKGDLVALESTIHTQEQPGATNEWLEPVSDTQYNNLITLSNKVHNV